MTIKYQVFVSSTYDDLKAERDLDIAAAVVSEQVSGPGAGQLAAVLTTTAEFVRSGEFWTYSV